MGSSFDAGPNASRTDFGDQLRRLREAAGLSQEELAERAALSPNAISALERGARRHPYPATVRVLANALGLSDDERIALIASIPSRHARSNSMVGPILDLPNARSSLIGRDREGADIARMFRDEGARLVTLTGPGGIGKTRLSLVVGEEVAGDFPGGVLFIDLTPIRDVAYLTPLIAERLGIHPGETRDQDQTLASAIGQRQQLLILDNVEQIEGAGVEIARLLAANDHLCLLVTSRTRLRISGETVYPVPPLALPTDLTSIDQLADNPAVRLYAERAHAADHGFDLTATNASTVAEICCRLEGLPLAIELAAARARHLSPVMLLARLSRRLPLLTFGAHDQPSRQRTMRDSIGWSYALLSGDEQTLFRRLSVFAGSFSLKAAESVMSDALTVQPPPEELILDGVSALVDANLVRPEPEIGGMPSFRMLETIREYGLEQLVAVHDERGARDAHAAYFAGFDQRLDPNRVEPGERVDDRLWRIETDYSNFRAALIHLAEVGDTIRLLRLSGAMAVFWHHRGHLDEGRHWLEVALTQTPDFPSRDRARAIAGLSLVIWSQGDTATAIALARTCRAMAETLGDDELIALSMHLHGIGELIGGDQPRARQLMEDALERWRVLGVWSNAAMALSVLSALAYGAGDTECSARRAEEAYQIFRKVGHPSGISRTLVLLARLARSQGNGRNAALAYKNALEVWADVDARWSSVRPPFDQSKSLHFPQWASFDDCWSIVCALTGLARFAAEHGQSELAAVLLGAIGPRMDDHGPLSSRTQAADFERAMAAARDALGEQQFVRLLGVRQPLSLGEAVDIALEIVIPVDDTEC